MQRQDQQIIEVHGSERLTNVPKELPPLKGYNEGLKQRPSLGFGLSQGEQELGYREEEQESLYQHERQMPMKQMEENEEIFNIEAPEEYASMEIPNFMEMELQENPFPQVNLNQTQQVEVVKNEPTKKFQFWNKVLPTKTVQRDCYAENSNMLLQEVSRFKILTVMTAQQRNQVLQTSPEYKKLYEDTIQGAQGTSDKPVVYQQLQKRLDYSFLTYLRRFCRIFYHLAILVIICTNLYINHILVWVFLLGYLLTVNTGQLQLIVQSGETILNIDAANCLINIRNGKTSFIEISYDTLKSISAFIDKTKMQTEVSFHQDESTINLKLLNNFDLLEFCIIDMYIPTDFSFKQLNIQCRNSTQCTLVQGSTLLSATEQISFTTTGLGIMQSNLASLQSPKFFATGQQQDLIINDILVQDLQINIDVGTVIFQTLASFNLMFNTTTQSVCGSAPGVFNPVTQNCFISGVPTTEQFTTLLNASCSGLVAFCKDPAIDCSSETNLPLYNITTRIGGIYANILQNKVILQILSFNKKSQPSKDNVIFQNGQFDNGLQFDQDFKERVIGVLNKTQMEADFIFQFYIGGSKYMQSSSVSYWTYFSNPSFALIRPWWLSTLSATLLTAQSSTISGFLNPGFCPYQSYVSLEKMREMQILIDDLLSRQVGQANFIQPFNRNLPISEAYSDQQKTNGVEWFYNNNFDIVMGRTESWYTVEQRNGKLILDKLDSSENSLIIASIILSICVAISLSCLCNVILKGVFVTINEKLLESSIHHGNYCQADALLNSSKDPLEALMTTDIKINIGNLLEKSGWKVFLRDAPLFSSTIDYYGYMTAQKFLTNSPFQFFKYLFREATQEEEKKFIEGELEDSELLSVKEKQLKHLYEKFCFLNHYQPLSLTSSNVISNNLLFSSKVKQILHSYGYQIVDDIEKSQVFLKLCILSTPKIPSNDELDTNDTIDLFIRMFYTISGIVADSEWFEDFQEKYEAFTKKYQLERIDFRPQVIAEKYYLEIAAQTRKKLAKNKHADGKDDDFVYEDSPNQNIVQKYIAALQMCFTNKNIIYLIDKEQLEFHFQILVDPSSFLQNQMKFAKLNQCCYKIGYIFGCYNKKQITLDPKTSVKPINIIVRTIYYRYWYLVDLVIVAMHYSVVIVLGTPIFLLIFISKFSYAPYSLFSPQQILTGFDLIYRPWIIPFYFLKLELYIQVMLGILVYFLLMNYIQDLVIYMFAEFPEDASFRSRYQGIKKAGYIIRGISIFQWIFLFILFFIICFYIGLILVWLILGAIINPNMFLVYATSVSTLTTIVTAKGKEIESLYQKGIDQVKGIVEQLYQETVKEISDAIIEGIQTVKQEAQEIMGPEATKQLMGAADDLGFGDEMKQLTNVAQSVNLEESLKNPQEAVKRMQEMKAQIFQKVKSIFESKLRGLGLTQDFAEILTICLSQKPEFLEKPLGQFIEKETNGKINASIISWLFENLQILKNSLEQKDKGGQPIKTADNRKDRGAEMILRISQNNTLLLMGCLDIMIKLFVEELQKDKIEINEEQITYLKQIFSLIIQFIITIKEGQTDNLLPMLKTIFQMCSQKLNLEQDNMFIFFKVIDLIELYMKKQLDETIILKQINEFFAILSFPEEIKMLFTIMLSKGQTSEYKSGKLVIANDQQLQFFFNSILNQIGGLFLKENNDSAFYVGLFAECLFLLFKLQKGQLKSDELHNLLYKLIQQAATKLTDQNSEKDFKVQLEERFSPQTVEFFDSMVSFIPQTIPMVLQAGQNPYESIKELLQTSGVKINLLQDIVSLGSVGFWAVLGSFDRSKSGSVNAKSAYINRKDMLLKNKIVGFLSSQLRMKQEVLVAIIQLMNNEINFYDDSDLFDELIYYLSSSIGAKEEAKIQELKPLLQLFLASDKIQVQNALISYQQYANLFNTSQNDDINPVNRYKNIEQAVQAIFKPQIEQKKKVDVESKDASPMKRSIFVDQENNAVSPDQKSLRGSLYYFIYAEMKNQNSEFQGPILQLIDAVFKQFTKVQIEKIYGLLNSLSIKNTSQPMTGVQVQLAAFKLSQLMNFKPEVLNNLVTLVQFNDKAKVIILDQAFNKFYKIVETIFDILSEGFSQFSSDFNEIQLDANYIKQNGQLIKDKINYVVTFAFNIDKTFNYQNLKELIKPFIPEWIQPGLDFIVAELFNIPVKPSQESQIMFLDNLLSFLQGFVKIPKFDLFKKFILAMLSRDGQAIEGLIRTELQTALNLDPIVAQMIQAFSNNDMLRLMSILFRDKGKDFTSFSIDSLTILINILGGCLINNQRGIERFLQRENIWLQQMQAGFRWHTDFVWIMGNLKFFFTKDLQAFSDFAALLLKKLFKFDAISPQQIFTILSVFTQQPQINDLAQLLKLPAGQIEFASFFCRMTINAEKQKLEIINSLKESPELGQLFKSIGIEVTEFSYLLKFVTKQLSAIEWRDFLSIINFGPDTNKNIVLGLLAMTASFDHMIPSNIKDLSLNYNIYKDMRAYLFQNVFGDDTDPYEFIFNIKQGRMNNLQMLNQSSPLLKTNTLLFGPDNTNALIVGSVLSLLMSDNSEVLSWSSDQISYYMATLDQSYCIRNSFQSAMYSFYCNLGISPLIIMGIFGNKNAIDILNKNLTEKMYGVQLKWEDVQLYLEYLGDYSQIDQLTKLKIMECEFLSNICDEMKSFGIDDIDNQAKGKQQKINMSMLNKTLCEELRKLFPESILTVLDKNLNFLFQCNPFNNTQLWNVNYPMINLLLVQTLVELRNIMTIKNKVVDDEDIPIPIEDTDLNAEKVQKSLKMALLLDLCMTLIEKILFVYDYDTVSRYKKKSLTSILQVILCNKNIMYEQKLFQQLQYQSLEFMNYPSLTDPFLIMRNFCEDELLELNENQRKLNEQRLLVLEGKNPFIIDFSDPKSFGKAVNFKEDPTVRLKLVCKAIIGNLPIYQKCFMKLFSSQKIKPKDKDSPSYEIKILEKEYINERQFYSQVCDFIFKGIVVKNRSNSGVKNFGKRLRQSIQQSTPINLKQGPQGDWISLFQMMSTSSILEQVKMKTLKLSPFFIQNVKDKVSQNTGSTLDQILNQTAIQLRAILVKIFIIISNLKDIETSQNIQKEYLQQQDNINQFILLILNIQPDKSRIFSRKIDQLKNLIEQVAKANPDIKIGSPQSIELTLTFINYLVSRRIEAKNVLIQKMEMLVYFKSNSKSLMKLLKLIIQPESIDKFQVDWMVQNCLDGNQDVFYAIIVPLLKVLKEQFPQVAISDYITYFSYGDGLDSTKKEEIEAYSENFQKQFQRTAALVNKKHFGDALENLLSKAQSIPGEQRKMLKILISCFMGEIEGWMNLMEELKMFDMWGLTKRAQLQKLMGNLFIGFKGSNLRKTISGSKLKGTSILTLVTTSNFKEMFFDIISSIDQTASQDFKDVQSIVESVAQRNYIKLIREMDLVLKFVIQKENQYYNDIKGMMQLFVSFAAIDTLNGEQLTHFVETITAHHSKSYLEEIFDLFSQGFRDRFVDLKQMESYVIALFKFQNTHDYNCILEEFLKAAQTDQTLNVIVEPIRLFLSGQLWLKMKYLSQFDNVTLKQAFPTIIYPFIFVAKTALGEQVMNLGIPNFEQKLQEALFQTEERVDRFIILTKLLKNITNTCDIKQASKFFSPTSIGFLMKSFEDHSQIFKQFIDENQSFVSKIVQSQLLFLTPLLEKIQEGFSKLPELIQIFSSIMLILVSQSGIVSISKDEVIKNTYGHVVNVMIRLIEKIWTDEVDKTRSLESQKKELDEIYDYLKKGKSLMLLINQLYLFVQNQETTNYDYYLSILKNLAEFCSPYEDKVRSILMNVVSISTGEIRADNIDSLLVDLVKLFGECQFLKQDDQKQLQNLIRKITYFSHVFVKLKQQFEDFTENGFDIQVLLDLINEIFREVVGGSDVKQISDILQSILAIYKLNFNEVKEEFFIFLKIPPQQAHMIKQLLVDFKTIFENPQKLLEQKSSQLLNSTGLNKGKGSSVLALVSGKLKEGKPLSNEDLFAMVDFNQNKLVDVQEFQKFLRRTGINLTEHKLMEIFTSIRGASGGQQLDEHEFEKAMEYIQKQSIFLTLENLGVTKELLTFALILLVCILLLLFAFIFVGTAAFAIPGTFGSIMNSILPVGCFQYLYLSMQIAGGGGVTKAGSHNEEQLFNIKKLKEIVRGCMKIVQSTKI